MPGKAKRGLATVAGGLLILGALYAAIQYVLWAMKTPTWGWVSAIGIGVAVAFVLGYLYEED